MATTSKRYFLMQHRLPTGHMKLIGVRVQDGIPKDRVDFFEKNGENSTSEFTQTNGSQATLLARVQSLIEINGYAVTPGKPPITTYPNQTGVAYAKVDDLTDETIEETGLAALLN